MSSQKRMRENTVELPYDEKFEESRLLSQLGTLVSNIPSDLHTSSHDVRVSRFQPSLIPTHKSDPITAKGHHALPDGLCYSQTEQSFVSNYFSAVDNVKKQLIAMQIQSPGVIKYLKTLEHYKRFVIYIQESILREKHDMNMRYDTRLLQENMGFIKRVCSLLKEYSLSQPYKKLKVEPSTSSDLSWENEFISTLKLIKQMTQEQKQEFKSHLTRVRNLPKGNILARRSDNFRYL